MDKIQQQFRNIKDTIESMIKDRSYPVQHVGRMFSTDVKLYNQCVDIEDEIDEYLETRKDLSPEALEVTKEHLSEEFTEDKINKVFCAWIEMEQNLFTSDYLQGHCHEDNTEEYKYVTTVGCSATGFYGRSGGHFCIEPISHIQSNFDELKELMEDYRGLETLAKDVELIRNIKHDMDGIEFYIKALEYVLDSTKKMKDGLDFKEEIKYRIIEDAQQFEALIARYTGETAA